MRRKLLIVSALALSVFLGGCADKETDVADQDLLVEDNVDVEDQEVAEDDATDVEEDAVEEDTVEEDAVEEDVVEDQGLAWPGDLMPNVPEFEGDIFKVNDKEANHRYVAYEGVSHEQAVEYISILKEAGFTENADEYVSDYAVNFKGNDKDNNFVKLRWSQNGYISIDMITPTEE